MKKQKYLKKVEIIRKENIGKKGMAFFIGDPALDRPWAVPVQEFLIYILIELPYVGTDL